MYFDHSWRSRSKIQGRPCSFCVFGFFEDVGGRKLKFANLAREFSRMFLTHTLLHFFVVLSTKTESMMLHSVTNLLFFQFIGVRFEIRDGKKGQHRNSIFSNSLMASGTSPPKPWETANPTQSPVAFDASGLLFHSVVCC
jgi:hypothetical protein